MEWDCGAEVRMDGDGEFFVRVHVVALLAMERQKGGCLPPETS